MAIVTAENIYNFQASVPSIATPSPRCNPSCPAHTVSPPPPPALFSLHTALLLLPCSRILLHPLPPTSTFLLPVQFSAPRPCAALPEHPLPFPWPLFRLVPPTTCAAELSLTLSRLLQRADPFQLSSLATSTGKLTTLQLCTPGGSSVYTCASQSGAQRTAAISAESQLGGLRATAASRRPWGPTAALPADPGERQPMRVSAALRTS